MCLFGDGAFTLTGWDFETMVRFDLPFIGIVEQWTMRYTKFQVMDMLNDIDVPCGPILDMKELIEDKALAERGMIVDVHHPERGVS